VGGILSIVFSQKKAGLDWTRIPATIPYVEHENKAGNTAVQYIFNVNI
jgi:hypothetical protein